MLFRLVCSWDTSQMPQLRSMTTIGTTLNVGNDKVFVVVYIEMLLPSFHHDDLFFLSPILCFHSLWQFINDHQKTFHSFFTL
jgi:hypothetical protein